MVGAGAAGIFAAWRAAQLGARVLLLEKTPRLGTKILISGGGKCNITHDGPLEEVLRAFRPNEARFLRPACYRFTNRQVVEMLTSRGLEVYTRPDGRIFPVHQTAKDVVSILGRYLDEARVTVRRETPVQGLRLETGRAVGLETAGGSVEAHRVILATGGSSYPNSGTTGDGWAWAKAAGHSIVKVRAALAPMYLHLEPDRAEWSGVALRDCLLKARLGKEIARWRGDLLFTHHGISGPVALGVSRVVAERFGDGEIRLEVDLRPDVAFEAVGEQAKTWCHANPRKRVSGFVEDWVPARLVEPLLASAGIEAETVAGNLPQKSRNRLVACLKGWDLGVVRHVPLEKGEVVAGGVALDEVDPQTMRSRCCDGLYLCGEILDIAGPVGGYNLQAAFATGYVAGETAAGDAGFSP